MVLVIAATIASYGIGWLIGLPWLVPFLNAAYPWWRMAAELRRGDARRAVGIMLIWALTMGVVSTAMVAMGWSRKTDGSELFLRASYRDEMTSWVRTGIGAESQPLTFIPRHLGYAAVFSATALATGGLLAMPMGALLVNQMGEYVGGMVATSSHPAASAILGWHPWAVIRIIAFVTIGVVLSGVVLSRVLKFPYSLRDQRRLLQVAGALLLLDIALKWALAPAWQRILKGVAGW
jgi:hypothetical protein